MTITAKFTHKPFAMFGILTVFAGILNAGYASPESVTADEALTISEIPVQFRGHWTWDLEKCAGGYDEGRLILEPTHIRFFESAGPATAVETRGASEVTVTANLYSEGNAFSKTTIFQLSGDGASLTNKVDETVSAVRYRCPEA